MQPTSNLNSLMSVNRDTVQEDRRAHDTLESEDRASLIDPQELLATPLDEPATPHYTSGWNRVALDLHEEDRDTINRLVDELGVKTRRNVLRICMRYVDEHLDRSRLNSDDEA